MKLNNITAEPWQFIIDHAEKQPQGVHLYYKGVPYPRKVYWSSLDDPNFCLRTLNALGIVKKYLFALTFLKSVVIPRKFNIKSYEPFLHYLSEQIRWTLEEFYIKDDEFSVPVWEMGKFFRVFLENLGLSNVLSQFFAKVGMMFLEFDNAYRYRPQDMAGETTKELLQNPRKELPRLEKIYLIRELEHQDDMDFGARGKITKLITLIRIALLLPKVKKAWISALNAIDLEKIRFDENDRFHLSFWRGYNYEGKTFEERFGPYEEIYKTIPFKKREDYQATANFMTGN
jgi:hypothetical protein